MFTIKGFAQVPEDPDPVTDGCTGYEGARGRKFVEFFLTLDNFSTERVLVGASNVSISEIAPVSEEAACVRLSSIISNNAKYQTVDQSISNDETKYYYQTNDFYYIFWAWKPENDNRIRFGPKRLFIVVSGDFENVWEFYK
ncbi:MAG: hypothetical protein ABJJ14_00505 [Cyclobacteriaceae bacterium]